MKLEKEVEKGVQREKMRKKSREEIKGEKEWKRNEHSRKWSWSGNFDEAMSMVNESEEARIRRGSRSNERQGGESSRGVLMYSEALKRQKDSETETPEEPKDVEKKRKELEELERVIEKRRKEEEELDRAVEERRKNEEELGKRIEKRKKEWEDLERLAERKKEIEEKKEKMEELEKKDVMMLSLTDPEKEQLIEDNGRSARDIIKNWKKDTEESIPRTSTRKVLEKEETLVIISEEVSLSPVIENKKKVEKQKPETEDLKRVEKRRGLVKETKEQQPSQRRRTHLDQRERPPPPPPAYYYDSRQVEKLCLNKYEDKLSRDEKSANESIRRDVFEKKDVVQHGKDLLAASMRWMKKLVREARTKEDVIAIMKFLEIQIDGQRVYLVERVREECQRLVREGKMPKGRGHGHYYSDMRGNRKFLGWYVQESKMLRETAEQAERIPPEMLIAGRLGLKRLCTLHERFAVFK